eukprot:3390157-Rhodomonas_salina.1
MCGRLLFENTDPDTTQPRQVDPATCLKRGADHWMGTKFVPDALLCRPVHAVSLSRSVIGVTLH